uniref:RNase_Zc3h12a domain-containing protein n=1 Tax=Parastrongyloides trichosuri TaxID=131310 RepID=A0A0N4Z8S7_PARTI
MLCEEDYGKNVLEAKECKFVDGTFKYQNIDSEINKLVTQSIKSNLEISDIEKINCIEGMLILRLYNESTTCDIKNILPRKIFKEKNLKKSKIERNLNIEDMNMEKKDADVLLIEEEELSNSGTDSYADIELMESISPNINDTKTIKNDKSTVSVCVTDGKWINSNVSSNLTALSNWIASKFNESLKNKPFMMKLQSMMEVDKSSIKKLVKTSCTASNNDLSTISSVNSCPALYQNTSTNLKVINNDINIPINHCNIELWHYMQRILKEDKCGINFFNTPIDHNIKNEDNIKLLAQAYYKLNDMELPESRMEYLKIVAGNAIRKAEVSRIETYDLALKILIKQLNDQILNDSRATSKRMKAILEGRLKNIWSTKQFKKILLDSSENFYVLPKDYYKKVFKCMTRNEIKALKYYKWVNKRRSKNINRYLVLSNKYNRLKVSYGEDKSIEEMICDSFYKFFGIKRQTNMAGFYELRRDQFSNIIVSIIKPHFWKSLPLQKSDFEKFMKSEEMKNMIGKIVFDMKGFLKEFIHHNDIPDIISKFENRIINCLNDFLRTNQPLTDASISRSIVKKSNIILKIDKSIKRKKYDKIDKTILLKKGMTAYKKYVSLLKSIRVPIPGTYGNLSLTDPTSGRGSSYSNINSGKSQKLFEKIDSTISSSSFSSRGTRMSSEINSNGIRYLYDGEFIINPERSIYSSTYKHETHKKNLQALSNDKMEANIYSVAIDECDKSVIERNSDTLFRPVYVNGVEAGYSMQSKKGDLLCVRGITITINYFLSRGHQVQAFLPSVYKHHPDRCDNYDELLSLYEMNLVEFTQEYGADKYVEVNCQILQRAIEFGGCIVARSQMHVIVDERSIFSKVVEERLLMPTFCDEDIFFPLDGPLGRLGNSFNDTLLCRKYEEDWDRVRLQQLNFRDQKIWLFALAYLLESDKWFRQAEFLEGYYAKPLNLPPANVSSYLLNSAKYYQPHPPETCTKSSRGYRLIKLQKKSSSDYRLVRNRTVSTEICLEEQHRLLQNEVIEFMSDPLIKKLFRQRVADKIPSYILTEHKGFRLCVKPTEKKFTTVEDQRLRGLYTVASKPIDQFSSICEVTESRDYLSFDWKSLNSFNSATSNILM